MSDALTFGPSNVIALAGLILVVIATGCGIADFRAECAIVFGLALLTVEIFLVVWLAHAGEKILGIKAEAVRSTIEHEDTLINNRLGWLTAVQTLLFGGYAAFSRDALDGARVVPWAGILSTIVMTCSVVAAVAAIENLKAMHEELHAGGNCTANHLSVTSPRPIHILGLVAPLALPAMLAAAWIAVLFYQ